MRQRKLKNLDERLDAFSRFIIEEPAAHRGRWKEVFGNDKPIWLEIGCGKGQFTPARGASPGEKLHRRGGPRKRGAAGAGKGGGHERARPELQSIRTERLKSAEPELQTMQPTRPEPQAALALRTRPGRATFVLFWNT